MSTTVDAKPRTAHQRSLEATRSICATLGLANVQWLSAALAEAVAEELVHNHTLASRIKALYGEVAAVESARPRRSRPRRAAPPADLVPLKHVEGLRGEALARLDPYFLLDVYGAAQLRAALSGYTRDSLKAAADDVMRKNPGTRPTNRGHIDSLVDYIVEQLAGHGY
jgi:hypothetical protein